MSAKKPSLDDLVREAKEDFVPRGIDWGKIEAELMPRVEREARAQQATRAFRGRGGAWVAAGLVVAAAASIPLFFARGPAAPLDAALDEGPERAASTVAWKEPRAVITRTHGAQTGDANVGEAMARGDAIEVHGGRAVLERAEPGQVTWGLEDGARVVVASARGALILALEKGAVEAQVAPVAAGEAFAIDVGGARVAVHGTHLRVAQEGPRVVVDLREGVVSIGLPPKSGSTYGDLVTAPAHVEFDPADPHGSLKVTHDAARVRAAASLERPAPVPVAGNGATHIEIPPPSIAPAPAPSPRPAPAPIAATPTPPTPPAPKPAAPAAPPVAVTSPEPPPPAPARVDSHPEQSITDAIRACAREHQATLPPGVVLTVTSRLDLRVGDRGMPLRAQFDPPLAPELRECAARAIYATRFSTPGAVSIPIDFSVP